MAEILTESFCERCGTRYTFESAAPRKRLGSFRTLSRGLKNFVLSDDTSLDDALAAARSDLEREVTAQQLDAFHKTFNFCMSCRQYTCANCWNEVEGRCLTCAPHLGHEILPAPFPDLEVDEVAIGHAAEPAINGHARGALDVAWPTSDLERAAAEPEPVAEAVAEPEAAEEEPAAAEAEPVAAEAEPVAAEAEPVAAEQEPIPEPELVAAEPDAVPAEPQAPVAPRRRPDPARVDDRAAAAAAATAELLARFRPGQSIDAALEAYEAEQGGVAAAASASEAPSEQSEPAVDPTVSAPESAPADAPSESEPLAAPDAEPLPEPAVAAPPSAPTPQDDRIETPSWQVVAPAQQPRAADGHPAERPVDPPQPPPSRPEWPAVPQWPARPEEPTGIAAILAARSAGRGTDALWAASNREVAAPAAAAPSGVQSCVSCGLSLSATARFCRRCGTRQGG